MGRPGRTAGRPAGAHDGNRERAMTWPDRVQVIVNTLAAGVAHTDPDDVRRAVTQKIAEQCRFEFGPNWGTKRADPGRPLSTDVVCTQSPFVGWDWSVPGGIAQFPESIDLTGQVFVVVSPGDHLGVVPPVPAPSPPVAPPVDLAPVLAEIAELRVLVLLLLDRPPVTFPAYEGSAAVRYL